MLTQPLSCFFISMFQAGYARAASRSKAVTPTEGWCLARQEAVCDDDHDSALREYLWLLLHAGTVIRKSMQI